jgi:CheY-like chemotaxis protein
MDKLSILIIEDNPADIVLIKEYLSEMRNFSYELKEAGTLQSALGLFSHYDFDVVLLDLSLPDSSGVETVRTLISKYPEVAVIVLTSLQDEEVALMSVRFGAQDYLEKQLLSPAMLYRSIIYSLERKRTVHEKEELFNDLSQVLKKIEMLESILPLCLNCKKILGENQQWLTIEEYVAQRSAADMGQSICPVCKNDLESDVHG